MKQKDLKVIIYGAECCAFCHEAMRYLDKKDIGYEYRNVDENPAWAEETVKKSGQYGIPVLDMDGVIIVGFDRPKIDATIKSKNLS